MRALSTRRRSTHTASGVAAGMIGGLFASWVMNQFQAGLKKLQSAHQSAGRGEEGQGSARPESAPQRQLPAEDEPATVKAAVALSETVFRHQLADEEKQPAGSAVHYVFGALSGGMYGALAEHIDAARAGSGLAFGAALWLGSDEMAVPLAGLSKPAREYSAATHLSALAAHLVYGVTTELVRRGLREGVLAG